MISVMVEYSLLFWKWHLQVSKFFIKLFVSLMICMFYLNNSFLSGNCGVDVDLGKASGEVSKEDILSTLFAEELGLVLEVDEARSTTVINRYVSAGIPCVPIGKVNSFYYLFYAITLCFRGPLKVRLQ